MAFSVDHHFPNGGMVSLNSEQHARYMRLTPEQRLEFVALLFPTAPEPEFEPAPAVDSIQFDRDFSLYRYRCSMCGYRYDGEDLVQVRLAGIRHERETDHDTTVPHDMRDIEVLVAADPANPTPGSTYYRYRCSVPGCDYFYAAANDLSLAQRKRDIHERVHQDSTSWSSDGWGGPVYGD